MHLTGVLSKVAVIIAAAVLCGVTRTFCQDEFDDSLYSRLKVDDRLQSMEARCEKNGGPGAYQNLQKGVKEVANCLSTALPSLAEMMNDANSVDEPDAVVQNKQIKPLIRKYCRIYPKVRQCDPIGKSSLTKCLNATETKLAQEAWDLGDSAINFACHEDGDRLIRFIAANGIACIENHLDELKKCAEPSVKIFEALPETGSEPDVCRLLADFKPCIMKAVKSCTEADDLLGGLVDIAYRAEKCEESEYAYSYTSPSGAPRATPMIVFGVGVVAAGYWGVARY